MPRSHHSLKPTSSILLSSSTNSPNKCQVKKSISCMHCNNSSSGKGKSCSFVKNNSSFSASSNQQPQPCHHLPNPQTPHFQLLATRPHRIASYSTIISTNNTSVSLINDILRQEDHESILVHDHDAAVDPLWRDLHLRNRDFQLMHLEMVMNRNYTTAKRLGKASRSDSVNATLREVIESDSRETVASNALLHHEATNDKLSPELAPAHAAHTKSDPSLTPPQKPSQQIEQQLYRYTDVVAFQYFGSGATRLGTELFTSSDMYITAILVEYERRFTGDVAALERQIAEMLRHGEQQLEEQDASEEQQQAQHAISQKQSHPEDTSLENVLLTYSRTNNQSKTFVLIHDDITDEKLDKYPIENFIEYRRQMMHISVRLARHGIRLFHYYTGRGTAIAHQVHYDPHHFNAPKTYHAMLDVLSVEDIIYIVGLNENFSRYFHTGLIGHFAQKLFEQSGGVPIFLEHALRIILHCSVILISGYDVEQLVEVTIPEYLAKHAPDLHNYRMHTAFDRNAAIILYAMAYHGVVLSKDTHIDVDSLNLSVSILELLARYPFYIQVISRKDQTFRIVHCPYHTRLFESQLSELQRVDPRYQFYFSTLERSFSDETNFVVEQLVRFSRKKSKSNQEYDPEHVSNLNKLLSSVKVVSGEKILVDDVPILSKQIKLKLDVYDQKVYSITIGPSMEETVKKALAEIGKMGCAAMGSEESEPKWVFLDLREQEIVSDLNDFRTNSLYLFEREGQYD